MAGGGSDDGRPATAADIPAPYTVAVDAAGNVYVADIGTNRIRKISTAGLVSTAAGTGTSGFSGDGGPATQAQLASPYSVISDSAGNLYIADQLNSRVRRVDGASGVITTVAGGGTNLGEGVPATAAQLSFPLAVALDAAGNLYIADAGTNRVRKVSAASGAITTIAGTGMPGSTGDGGPATAAQLNTPNGLALDRGGDVYVTQGINNRVRRISAANGTISTIAGTGTPGFSGDGGPGTAAQLSQP